MCKPQVLAPSLAPKWCLLNVYWTEHFRNLFPVMYKMRMLNCMSFEIFSSSGRSWIRLALVTWEQNQKGMRQRETTIWFRRQKFRISPNQDEIPCLNQATRNHSYLRGNKVYMCQKIKLFYPQVASLPPRAGEHSQTRCLVCTCHRVSTQQRCWIECQNPDLSDSPPRRWNGIYLVRGESQGQHLFVSYTQP